LPASKKQHVYMVWLTVLPPAAVQICIDFASFRAYLATKTPSAINLSL
jgi:hypothetical protein